jgi:hypothetical protein
MKFLRVLWLNPPHRVFMFYWRHRSGNFLAKIGKGIAGTIRLLWCAMSLTASKGKTWPDNRLVRWLGDVAGS